MKRVTLLRHAQADTALQGQSDYDRHLTRRGLDDAAEMARRLKMRRLQVDCCVTSPAPRAVATADVFTRALRLAADRCTQDDRLYAAGPSELLLVLHAATDQCSHLLIVAHNPGLTDFADKLSAERRIDAMPTCSLVMLRFAATHWRQISWHSGLDVELDYPALA